jgi:hypothetical protein
MARAVFNLSAHCRTEFSLADEKRCTFNEMSVKV